MQPAAVAKFATEHSPSGRAQRPANNLHDSSYSGKLGAIARLNFITSKPFSYCVSGERFLVNNAYSPPSELYYEFHCARRGRGSPQ